MDNLVNTIPNWFNFWSFDAIILILSELKFWLGTF